MTDLAPRPLGRASRWACSEELLPGEHRERTLLGGATPPGEIALLHHRLSTRSPGSQRPLAMSLHSGCVTAREEVSWHPGRRSEGCC